MTFYFLEPKTIIVDLKAKKIIQIESGFASYWSIYVGGAVKKL
jgi:hypothetical protein